MVRKLVVVVFSGFLLPALLPGWKCNLQNIWCKPGLNGGTAVGIPGHIEVNMPVSCKRPGSSFVHHIQGLS